MRTSESRPTPAAADGRKQAVSIRLNATDLRNVKKLAKRLHVRYSDIIRYAVKTSLAKLGPLLDGDVRGRSLVPVLVETGTDLVRYLDLDAAQLEAIINEGARGDACVDHADVQLLALSGVQQTYARLHLSRIGGAPARSASSDSEDLPLEQTLRRYLFDKYVYEAQRRENGVHQNGVHQP
jgi:hypothetical protein